MNFDLTTKEVCEHFKMLQPRLSQFKLGHQNQAPILFENIDYQFEGQNCMYSQSAIDKLEAYFDAKYYKNKTE